MKSKLLSKINFQGSVQPGAQITSKNQITLFMMWRDVRTAVCLQFDLMQCQVKTVWHHEFTGNTYHTWAGLPIKINEASLLPLEQKYLYMVAATERLLVNAKSGEIIAHTTASASPTKPASLIGNDLIVPEGRTLSGYDAISLNLKWQKPTPNGYWISAPSVGSFIPLKLETEAIGIFCSLDPDADDPVKLWNFHNDTLWVLPGIINPYIAPVVCGGVVVVSSGIDVPDHLIALDLDNGSLKWSIDCSSRLPASTTPKPSSRYLVICNGNSIILANAKPALETLSIIDGTCLWRVDLPSEPIVLAKGSGTVWVGTYAGDIVAVNAEDGTVRGWVKVSGRPSSILTLPDNTSAAIVIEYLGSIYHIELFD